MQLKQVFTAKPENQPQYFDEILKHNDSKMLKSCATKTETRPNLHKYLTNQKLEHIQTTDSDYLLLSIIAEEFGDLKFRIVDLAVNELTESPKPLNLFARLLANSKLDLKFENLIAVSNWLESSNEKWRNMALIVLRSLASKYRTQFVEFIKSEPLGNKKFALIGSLLDLIPEFADLAVEIAENSGTNAGTSAEADLSKSVDYWDMLSSVCNNNDQRLKLSKTINVFPELLPAQLVQAKILAGTTSQTGDIDYSLAKLDTVSKQWFESGDLDEHKIQGLVCSSGLALVKARVSQDLVIALVENMKTYLQTSYAVFVILHNLVLYPYPKSEELTKREKLRMQSLGKTVYDLSNDQYVTKLTEISLKNTTLVLKTDLLNWLVQNLTRLTPPTQLELAKLLASMASHNQKPLRDEMAKKSLVVIALYLNTTSNLPKSKQLSASAISKILASSPPSLALPPQVSVTTVINPLISQLDNEESEYQLLDTFESLRALTNLTSGDDMKLRALISLKVRPHIPSLMNSTAIPIIRSCLELVCNLMMDPLTTDDLKSQNNTAFIEDLVYHSLDTDVDSRLASSGALAILSQVEPQLIKPFVSQLLKPLVLFPNDENLSLRLLTCLENVGVPESLHNDLESVVSKISKNPQLLSLLLNMNLKIE